MPLSDWAGYPNGPRSGRATLPMERVAVNAFPPSASTASVSGTRRKRAPLGRSVRLEGAAGKRQMVMRSSRPAATLSGSLCAAVRQRACSLSNWTRFQRSFGARGHGGRASMRSMLARSRIASTTRRRAYRDAVSARGLRFVAVLAPSKYAVYAPWLPGARAPGDAPYLDRLERSLRDDGVEVVNLRSPLVAAAGDALGRGELLFHRDDTHWNAAGVEVAARAIAASGALGR